jgi:hypothetical protein
MRSPGVSAGLASMSDTLCWYQAVPLFCVIGLFLAPAVGVAGLSS